MKLDWHAVADSARITAEAYIPERQLIVVRFQDGTEWAYMRCSPLVWSLFQSSASRGQFIATTLDSHPNHEWKG